MNVHVLSQHRRRHGSLVRADLVPDHLSRSAWYRAHDSGLLVQIHPGVSRLPNTSMTPPLAIEAALAAAPGSLAAGLTGAWLWGAESASGAAVELLAPDDTHPGDLSGVRIHRSTQRPVPRQVPVRGVLACDPMQSTLQVAAWHPDLLDNVMAELVVAGRFSATTLRNTLHRQRNRGRPWVSAIERALDEWKLGDRPADSVLEVKMVDLLARHGLPAAEFQRPIGRYRPDFAFVDERAVVECDGWSFHGRTRKQCDDDRERESDLNALGWVVWRYTWNQITQREKWVASSLRKRLEIRRRDLQLPAVG